MWSSICIGARGACVAVAVGLFSLPAATATADWNPIGGNSARNSVTTERGPVDADVLWETDSSSATYAVWADMPFVWGNFVFTSRVASVFDISGSSVIEAFDLHTGQRVWTKQLPVIPAHPGWSNRVLGVHDGQLYVSRCGDGAPKPDTMYALDPATGDVIWESQHLVHHSASETIAFAENGDIICNLREVNGTTHRLARIDRNTGLTLWQTPYTIAASNGGAPAVSVDSDRVYVWGVVTGGIGVRAYSLASGVFKYHTGPIDSSAGLAQHASPMVGPDGTLYANRVGEALIAYEDSGVSLVEKWRVPMGASVFGTNAVGPNGLVYTIDPGGYIIAIDPSWGAVIHRTLHPVLDIQTMPANFQFLIDAIGRVYVNNGTVDNGFNAVGRIVCYTADLHTLIWSDVVAEIGRGGPAMGDDGILVVCDSGNTIRAYQTPQPIIPGDLNCDTRVDGGDLEAFALAVSDPAGFDAAYPTCDAAAGDFNGDSQTDMDDIADFVACILDGGC
ncbi:MAG: PQQ-binding-like beta-propeller repeat protein [Phycisphaerales bacterium]|nr:PQQ-binding-like beta-propeller repeat protein [Phycisphaerales bacterium]MCB9854283.1 PQQ-binding-like beta-propeller repeat protein [Phycisphaerales bacterium]MCB9863484.1 PQQ-binding-like beta-propeller repeat protein [Phycisphaerales bacterium]